MQLFGIRWRFWRDAEPKRGWRSALVLTGLFAVATVTAILWSRSVENSSAFWTANGVLAAGLLLLPRRLGVAFALACFGINFSANIVVGSLPMNLNVAYTSLNIGFSVVCAGLVRTFCGAALDLGRLRRFLPFLACVAGAALVEGLIGAASVAEDATQFFRFWRNWATCDGAGMILGLPATLMVMRGVNPLYAGPARPAERIAILAGLGIASYLAFSFAQAPIFLLLFPVALFAAFRLGSAWAFLGVWICVQAASAQTLANHGPIAVFDGAPPYIEVIHLQLYLVSLLLTASLALSAMAERVRSEQRLRRKAASSAAARARADQIVATRERFLAVVSHEIRTPLNGIQGFGEALARRPDLPAAARYQIEMIGSSTTALMEIVEDILDFSRIESGHLELDPTPCDVGQLAARVVEAARPCASAKGLSVTLTGEDLSGLRHFADARRLRQVLSHLVGNAVKFTETGGADLSIARIVDGPRDRLVFTVTDSGPGVPAARRGELFKPFAQLDPSLSRKHAGAGLGLSICRAIVELMDGEIAHADAEGGGALFRVSIPLVRLEAESPAAPAEDEELERAPRILVVDDHPMNREVARLFLDAFGCEVAEAEDGAAAVEAAKAAPFDVILMDLRMPGVDGLAATRMIRQLAGPAANTPILAVTADVMLEDIERCRAAGMNGHVPKPINQERLLGALSAALQGKSAFPADLAA